MKKVLKIFVLLLFSFFIITFTKSVQANSIDKISMDIYVDNSGTAHITEVWDCSTNKGTEVYHPYYNLGNSKISNLVVSEGSKNYSTLDAWNTTGSLDSKAYKCGINKISNGVELCWGISKYGSHTYIVKYDISNFVSNLTDSQMIYWTLIPYDFSETIGNVYIKVYADKYFADTTDVWGYGNNGGTCYVYNGYIEMQSSGSLVSSEYMTILVKFPLGTFNTTNNLNKDFNYYYNMSKQGSSIYTRTNFSSSSTTNSSSISSLNSDLERLFNVIVKFFIFIIFFIPFIVMVILAFATRKKFDFGTDGKKFTKDIQYFRDIPCNNDLFRAYYVAYTYGIITKKTDLLGAIILKWIKDSIIRIEQKEKGLIFKREDTLVILNETDTSLITNPFEKKLFDMLYEASIDGVLEDKEFEKWCNNGYSKILSWFDDIIKNQQENLITNDLITVEVQKKMKLFKKEIYHFSSELRKEAEEIYGLKRYLLDYTMIPQREAIEVHLFENYLIFAQILGISKEVAKEFKDLYPEVIEQSSFSSYDNIIFIQMCASNYISSANAAQSRAESYSSGGGGFSSGGGGGGSFGGGGGGGGFR